MMCPEGNRKIGCILGSAAADAAAQPLHWIYDIPRLEKLIGLREDIEFWAPSANPYYCIETGKQSCYGDQALAILQSLAECKGLEMNHMRQTTYSMFGPGSEYDSDVIDEYTWKGKLNSKYPIKNAWRHFSIKHFLKKMDEGSEDTGHPRDEQMDCVAKIPPMVAMYAGRSDLLDRVEDVIRMTEDNDTSVAVGLAAARILECCLLNEDMSDMTSVIQHVIDTLARRDRSNPQDLDKAVAGFLREVVRLRDGNHKETVLGTFLNS